MVIIECVFLGKRPSKCQSNVGRDVSDKRRRQCFRIMLTLDARLSLLGLCKYLQIVFSRSAVKQEAVRFDPRLHQTQL